MKEKNFTFTENQVELLCESIIAKIWCNNRAIEIIDNSTARSVLGKEQRELKDLLDYLTKKEG